VCLRLLQARPGLRICIVGHGDDEAHVRQRLAAVAGPDGPVRFAGRVPLAAMPDLYRRSRVYASTSYYEGLPGTCLEAMATGVPAVVWNLPFYSGLVVEGCSGLLAPVNDLECFTQRVLELIDQPDRAAALGRRPPTWCVAGTTGSAWPVRCWPSAPRQAPQLPPAPTGCKQRPGLAPEAPDGRRCQKPADHLAGPARPAGGARWRRNPRRTVVPKAAGPGLRGHGADACALPGRAAARALAGRAAASPVGPAAQAPGGRGPHFPGRAARPAWCSDQTCCTCKPSARRCGRPWRGCWACAWW